MARKRIGEMLVEAGLLDADGLRRALTEQRRWGGQLGAILIDLQLVPEDVLVRALSQQLNFPIVKLDDMEISGEVLRLVDPEMAEQHRIVPFHREGKFLDVAACDPTNLGIIDELRIRTQLNVRTYLAGPKSIERALARCYGLSTSAFGLSFADDYAANSGYTVSFDEEPQVASGSHAAAPARLSERELEREREIRALQERIATLEALVTRDENVIRKLLGLLVDKGVASRDEILQRISD